MPLTSISSWRVSKVGPAWSLDREPPGASGADPPSIDQTLEVFAAIGHLSIRRRFRTPEDNTGPLPVVSSDQMGTPSLLKPIQAYPDGSSITAAGTGPGGGTR